MTGGKSKTAPDGSGIFRKLFWQGQRAALSGCRRDRGVKITRVAWFSISGFRLIDVDNLIPAQLQHFSRRSPSADVAHAMLDANRRLSDTIDDRERRTRCVMNELNQPDAFQPPPICPPPREGEHGRR